MNELNQQYIPVFINLRRPGLLTSPTLIIFDVNETLLDLGPLKDTVGDVLGGREDLLPLWFTTMLHYSLVETMTDHYSSFGEIGTAALIMVAERQGIVLDYDTASVLIVKSMESLPPHEDVPPGLELLSQSSFRLVCLTNSGIEGVRGQFTRAGILKYFENLYSVDTVKKFKPHPLAYQQIIDDTGSRPEEILMVASHAWDLMGAKKMGMQTAFIARPHMSVYPNAEKPDFTFSSIEELARALQ